MTLDRAELRNSNRAELAHAAEVVAGQIDDHDVFGVILGARRESADVGRGAFDRSGFDTTAGRGRLDAQEQLGRRRHDVDVDTGVGAERAQARVRRRIGARERVVQRDGIGQSGCGQPSRQVHLIALAGAQQLQDPCARLRVVDAVEARRPRAEHGCRPLEPIALGGAHGRRESRSTATIAGQFELTVVVHDEPRVVARERDVGQVQVVGCARANAFDRAPEIVRGEPDPESAGVDFLQHVERRYPTGRPHGVRCAGDDRA